MTSIDEKLANWTRKDDPEIHGLVFKCVDKHGTEIYSKIAGYDSLSPDARPLREDAVFKLASASKLISGVALLQCIDKGLLTLDEHVSRILPELEDKRIVKKTADGRLVFEPATSPITARHLLTHTSGFAYRFLDPTLIAWSKIPEALAIANAESNVKYNVPLVFEPGTGWSYGVSFDWAAILVSCLHDNMNFEQYLIEKIWRPLGLQDPFPTFQLSAHPEYQARVMGGAEVGEDGKLREHTFWQGNDPDCPGGHGLCATARDYLAVLGDLISDTPKLLKPSTIDLMFRPHLKPGSAAMSSLLQLRPAWKGVAGSIEDKYVNHGLGGMLTTGPAPEIGQPAGLLCWGGAPNVVWFACREEGVAGFFGTQVGPFGAAKEVVDAIKKNFWESISRA